VGSVNILERSLVIVTVILVIVGVICVDTAVTPQAVANGSTIWGFMERDLVLVACGLGAFFVTCRVPLVRLRRYAGAMMVAAGPLLVVVHFSGSSVSGGQRWLGFGSVSFQPSEVFTLVSCFYLAVTIPRVERASRHWIDVLKWTLPVVVGAVLIFLEPDMGTASVLLIVAFGVLVLAGLPRRVMGLLTAAGSVSALVAAVAAPYRFRRLLALFHPSSAGAAATYQGVQARIALGSGRLTGLGFGQSRAKWGLLPNPHTDFIFAIVGEEFGFIGSVVILALFVWLLSLGVQVARRSPDRESQLLAGALTLWFGVEVFINVASVVGWWPVTGIPLPLISYGGTSLVIDLVALGLLVNLARRTRPGTPAVAASSPRRPVRPARATFAGPSPHSERVATSRTRERRRGH